MVPDRKRDLVRLTEDVPVIDDVDVCVLGGSCTGVFAAVRAARLGARVALVERHAAFGGLAAVTCTWHSLLDTEHRQPIIAGLTREVLDRLGSRGALTTVRDSESVGFVFRPGDLKIVLDRLVVEHDGIVPHLHTLFARPVIDADGALAAVAVESKSGRGIIRARAFVDATGDGDLGARLGVPCYRYDAPLPPTTCAFLDRWPAAAPVDFGTLQREHGCKFGIEPGFVWGSLLPQTDLYMLAGTRVRGVDCADARDLTRAEIEGRRQVDAMLAMARAARGADAPVLHDFPAVIGVRDTRHLRCRYQLRGEDVLEGVRFPDAIANGSYRVDTHHQDKPGLTFLYLDGRMTYHQPGHPGVQGRWREPRAANPTFYQIPLRSLTPAQYPNLFVAGRMLDADLTAFSAVRVMVNTNQTGEAAGVAAVVSFRSGPATTAGVDPAEVRRLLAKGGSIVF